MEEVVDVEYLSAWPPAENRPGVASEANSLSATIASGSPPAQKRFKHELTRCDRRLDSSCSGVVTFLVSSVPCRITKAA